MVAKAKDLKDLVRGGILVLSPTDQRDKHKSIMWLCRCLICGKEKHYSAMRILSRSFRSCGCLMRVRDPRTDKGHSGLQSFYSQYLQGAEKRDLEFSLNKEEFREITSLSCHYCGEEPNTKRYGSLGKHAEHGVYLGNGIDRIDSSLGYTKDNCLPCCWPCNQAKRDKSYQEFILWLDKIAEFRKIC